MAGSSSGAYFYPCLYGETTNQVIIDTTTFPTAQEVAEWPGHQLLNWNTAADGTGTAYQPGDSGVVESASYYAQWDYVDQEDLIISNHSLIDIGDAIRQTGKNIGSLTIPNMITQINNLRNTATPWYKQVLITGSGGYTSTYDCSEYINSQSEDYWFIFIATESGSSYYYKHYYYPFYNSVNPYYDVGATLNSTSTLSTYPEMGVNSNIRITQVNGIVTITGNSQNQLSKKKILLMYK